MTDPASTPSAGPTSLRGAVDLSQVARSAAPAPGGVYVTELTEANFEATLRQSARFPIVVEFYSPRDPGGAALSADLRELANAAGGAWLLARLNVDESAQAAAALQIRAVPTVVGVLAGQMVPLWQGTLAKEDAARYVQELLKVAAANGLLGKADPVVPETAEEAAADPRYEAAYSAMERGDFAQAEAEFDQLLAAAPNDAAARVGKAQAGLLARIGDPTPAAVAAAQAAADAPGAPVAAVLAAADFEVALGDAEKGFARLIAAIAATAGDERDTLRQRLLALFDTQPAGDPVVLRARRNLATALY